MENKTTAAYFAGGCFWCITPVYTMLDGVVSVVSGYCGGTEENPSYEQVKKQQTGHRETIKIVYDADKITYEELLDVFLQSVDCFDPDGQFIDRGHSYTLAVYFNGEEEKSLIEKKISDLEKVSGKKVYISVEPFMKFYEAEEYHQDYYRKEPENFEKEIRESGREEKYKGVLSIL